MNTRNRQTLRPPDAVRQDEDTGWRATLGKSAAWLVGFSFFSALLVMGPQAVPAAGIGEGQLINGVVQTSVPRYFSVPNYANSPLYDPADPANFPGMRKFVDGLPGLNATAANNLGQFIQAVFSMTVITPGQA